MSIRRKISFDLASSNKIIINDYYFMSTHNYRGPNIHFVVRKFGMASIITGITLYGGLKGYCGTFSVFSDYMRSIIRHSALMKTPSTYLPIERLISLRAMPNVVVYYPGDTKEIIAGWKLAMVSKGTLFVLSLGRHDVSILETTCSTQAERRAYVFSKKTRYDYNYFEI